ncbi:MULTISPECIES: hypothetical protein [Leptospira]|nr:MULTISPECIES: hypothetical protein [Leptospira]EMK09780.1 hypothetical protein LEP1GSC166_0593 [Leptospira kirschneri]KXZ28310.1 acetyltransferase [Leptospira kirschneri]KXZ33858.1 acetyltransferase [Leptospira sp. ZV016]
MDGEFCKLEPLESEIHSKELYGANSLDKNGKQKISLSSLTKPL